MIVTNYPMTQETTAQVYYDVKQVSSCIDPYSATYDFANAPAGLKVGNPGFTKDCKINLADFAALSEAWMANGLHPQQ